MRQERRLANRREPEGWEYSHPSLFPGLYYLANMEWGPTEVENICDDLTRLKTMAAELLDLYGRVAWCDHCFVNRWLEEAVRRDRDSKPWMQSERTLWLNVDGE